MSPGAAGSITRIEISPPLKESGRCARRGHLMKQGTWSRLRAQGLKKWADHATHGYKNPAWVVTVEAVADELKGADDGQHGARS